MHPFRLSTVSINQTPLDWNGNRRRIMQSLESLAQDPEGHPDLVLFPELVISGYGCEDAFHSPDVVERSFAMLRELSAFAGNVLPHTLVFLGLPFRYNDFIYNCVAAVHNGEIKGIVPKRNLAGDGVHYEPRWFAYDRETVPHEIRRGEDLIPFGSLYYEFKGVRIALEICEDAWVPARPAIAHLRHGIDIILNPAASHFALGKQNIRRNIVMESSRSLSTVFVMVNLLGNEAGRLIYDGGSIVASGGDLILESERFSFRDFVTHTINVNVEKNRVQRARIFSYREQELRSPEEREVKSVFISGPDARDMTSEKTFPSFTPGIRVPIIHNELEFLHAVALGLFDYMRKTRSSGYVISLSGGADSACSSVLVERMVALAIKELGYQGTMDRLHLTHRLQQNDEGGAIPNSSPAPGSTEDNPTAARFLTGKILRTIYQGSQNSGEVTRNAAREIARALGSTHHEFQIQGIVDDYVEGVEGMLERPLSWERDDLTLQNIQARARAPMAWILANATGSLLITTSNRSEAAVGYCTMDGDTAGGLAPIAGVSKDFIRRWLHYMETTGDPFFGTIPALRSINEQIPTAELRPGDGSQLQSDETDLMPYDVLDRIERLAVQDRRPPVEVYRVLVSDPDLRSRFSPDDFLVFIKRFFQLWSRNQWKRERYAPSFHLDDESLDPRTWYRFPILSGSYEEELGDLEKLHRELFSGESS